MQYVVVDRRAMRNSAQYIAHALNQQGMLLAYIRPYGYRGRFLERVVRCLPFFGPMIEKFCDGRVMLEDWGSARIVQVSSFRKITSLFSRNPDTKRKTSLNVLRKLSKSGERWVRHADGVVATNGVAYRAFEEAKRCGGYCVLNHPEAHFLWSRKQLQQEVRRNPEFKHTLLGAGWNGMDVKEAIMEYDAADLIVVGSEFARDTCTSEGVPASKIVVVPYGADAARLDRNKGTGRNLPGLRVLFVGTIGQRKGIRYVFDAYKRFRTSESELLLVGDYVGDPAVFRNYFKDYERRPFMGRDQLSAVYCEADVFLFPSLSEGMPLVVAEAMAHGLPIITSDRGGDEIVRHGIDGYVFQPDDTEGMAKALEALRADETLRKSLGENARLRAASFTWNAFGNKVAQVLSAAM